MIHGGASQRSEAISGRYVVINSIYMIPFNSRTAYAIFIAFVSYPFWYAFLVIEKGYRMIQFPHITINWENVVEFSILIINHFKSQTPPSDLAHCICFGLRRFKTTQKSTSYIEQANALSENKNIYQQQVYSQVLQDVLKRLDTSFKNFFRRVKEQNLGKRIKAGFPRFKPAQRYNSFCYPQSGFRLTNDSRRIQLSKIGCVRLAYSRPIEGKVKTCRVIRDVNQWFVILTCESEDKPVRPNSKPTVGCWNQNIGGALRWNRNC